MRPYRLLQLVISGICAVYFQFPLALGDIGIVLPVTELGLHPAPDGRFVVVLRKNGMGGGTDLFVMKGPEPIFYAADVTGYLWIDHILIYSSLPLYGSAGVYAYNPIMETRSSLVDGKENQYFQIKSFSLKTNTIEYYYSDDIRHADVENLKASKGAVRVIAVPKGL
jgi:hypothetical protein